METKKRKVIGNEGREIIARVYHFLKQEYELMSTFNDDKCDLSPLRNITQRTADATGVSARTVSKILMEERNPPSTSEGNTPKKRGKEVTKVKIKTEKDSTSDGSPPEKSPKTEGKIKIKTEKE